MEKILTLCSYEEALLYWEKANTWNLSQNEFGSPAAAVIAEYLANQDGKTLFKYRSGKK